MPSFFRRLETRAVEIDSLLCVGLDPHPDDLPTQTGEAARQFCLDLIAATADLAAAYKPNAAFFEALGPAGIVALKEVIAAIPEGIPVILDVKRGDIASTASAYARSAFEVLGADGVTINPYLGRDALTPFLADRNRGVFLLCKTSNPGAADLQDLPLWNVRGAEPDRAPVALYEHVARMAASWNRDDNLGLVVGATHPEALTRVRGSAPDLWILAPGVGAQGGDLVAALEAGLRADGLGILVSVSRGIARAADPRQAAISLRDAIRGARAQILKARPGRSEGSQGLGPLGRSIADGLLTAGCVRFGTFTLKSGQSSPIYIDLRRLASRPALLSQVAGAFLPALNALTFDRLAPLPYAALPIGTAVSLQGGWPMIYPRKEVKDYGTGAAVEGEYAPGERVVVIDDLITTGGSKIEAIEKLTAAGLSVGGVVVLIDRRSAGEDSLNRAGYPLHAVFTLSRLLDYWEEEKAVPPEQLAAARDYLAAP
jgi:uridine monophosphate synthetase